jgi:hypothetical protein
MSHVANAVEKRKCIRKCSNAVENVVENAVM